MKKYFICCTVCLCSFFMHAQGPGYLGKHLSISYDPSLFIALNDEGDNFSDVPNITLNYRHNFNLEYAVSRGVTLGLTGEFLSTKMYATQVQGRSYYDPFSGNEYTEGFIGDLKIHSKAIGIIVKNYSFNKRGSIAPVGKYKSFELTYMMPAASTLRTHDYTDEDYYYRYFDSIIPFEALHYEAAPMFALIFGGGTNSVLKNFITYNLGWEIGMGLSPAFIEMLSGKSREASDEEEFQYNVKERIFGAYFINFRIGIGYLLI